MSKNSDLFEFILRLGDNTLILGHRVSEWCGHAPVLEEDIALANTALDLIGQTQLWLDLAGEVEGKERDADKIAFLRDFWEFRNVLLVELSNGDFGRTMMRQFLFDAWHSVYLGRLIQSSDQRVAGIAEKASKEVTYHFERSSAVVVSLGDGTEESHDRMQDALNYLWPYVGEFFNEDDIDRRMAAAGIGPDIASLSDEVMALIKKVLSAATLSIPEDDFSHSGGRNGSQHTEHLGHLLTQMQWLQRAYPGASW